MSEAWLAEIAVTAWDVILAVVPLMTLFLIFQLFLLKLPRRRVADILKGTAVSTVGLFLFLLGIGIGFVPFGRALGEALGRLDQTWLFIFIGSVLGFLTTWGEPGVRILANQVEEASNGSIRRPIVLSAVCIGVAVLAGLGILRISYGVPLLYLLAPGYVLVIGLLWLCHEDFVSIAVDAGGVATGPLANTFLLALALGASAAMGNREPIIHGFGFVALVALAPLISVMVLGLLVQLRARSREDAEPMSHREHRP